MYIYVLLLWLCDILCLLKKPERIVFKLKEECTSVPVQRENTELDFT